MPGIVSSVVFFIVGAVLKFAYDDTVWRWTSGGNHHTLHLDTLGVILMIAGAVMFLISLLWNFFLVAPVDETEYDEMVVKKPYEEPEKVVRRRSKKTDL